MTYFRTGAAAVAALLFSGFAQAAVIQGTTGAYMSPFTSDGVTAGWVTKSMSAKASGQIGGAVGSYAAQKMMENIPFASMFGQQAGQAVGRAAALQAIGGEAYLKSSTDQSFSNLQDMAQYIKDNFSDRKDIGQIMESVYAIYPDLHPVYDATGALMKVGKSIDATAVPNAQGVINDLYRVSVDSAQTIRIVVASTEMAPEVSVTRLPDSKVIGVAKAAKGATDLTLDAPLPTAGDYQVAVHPISGFFGQGKGGAYKLTINGADAKVAAKGTN